MSRIFPPDAQVFSPDNVPDRLFFPDQRRLRVTQISDQGRDVVLYRVEAGEGCVP